MTNCERCGLPVVGIAYNLCYNCQRQVEKVQDDVDFTEWREQMEIEQVHYLDPDEEDYNDYLGDMKAEEKRLLEEQADIEKDRNCYE